MRKDKFECRYWQWRLSLVIIPYKKDNIYNACVKYWLLSWKQLNSHSSLPKMYPISPESRPRSLRRCCNSYRYGEVGEVVELLLSEL